MKDTNIYERWQRHDLFGRGKAKSVKYWTALGRALISHKFVVEVMKTMNRQESINKYVTESKFLCLLMEGSGSAQIITDPKGPNTYRT
jgi:hypothetical protein